MPDFFQTRYAKMLPNGEEDKCCYIQQHGLNNQVKPRVFRIFGEIKVFRIFGVCLEPATDTRN